MRVLIDSNHPHQPLLMPPACTHSPGALYKLRFDHSSFCELCCREGLSVALFFAESELLTTFPRLPWDLLHPCVFV